MKDNIVRKGLVLGIILLFVGTGVIAPMGGIIVQRYVSQDNKTSFMDFNPRGNILYVGGTGEGNYSKIQDAIDNASEGDTVFIYDDLSPYYENVIVNKSINLIGEDKDTTIIDGGNNVDVVYVSADWVNISGLTLRNSGSYYVEEHAGITVRTNCSTISGNNIIWNNMIGINLRSSSNNNIIGNTISWNNWEGIFLWYSSNNTITGNTICSNNWDGILLWDGSNSNIITGNNINPNNADEADGIDIHGSSNVITGNTVTSSNINGIVLRGDSNTITGNNISNNEYGIGLRGYSSCNNIITDNNIASNNWDDIALDDASNNNITGNNISNNGLGLYLYDSSNNNTIASNNINSNDEEGIYLIESSNNAITGNSISENKDGIELKDSNSNTINENNISSNYDYGIEVIASPGESCIHNIITGNNIISNIHGIYLENSSSNTNLKNNFINNQYHAFFISCKNIWKQNYWDRPRILPKLIFGKITIGSIEIPWVNIDWRPALKPYEMGV